MAKAGAAEKGVPLYKHIADLAGNTKLVGMQRDCLAFLVLSVIRNMVMHPSACCWHRHPSCDLS